MTPSRSVAMGAAVDQIKRLVDRGYKEVVLTGVDMTSWGADLPGTPRLGQLMQSIEGRQFMAHANSILDGEEMTKETAQVFDQREITI